MSTEPVIAPPKLRGWFHLAATPLVIIASLVLFILSGEPFKFAVRWLYVANYLILGWVAVIYTPQLYKEGGLWVIIPILVGGLLYSIGAIFYALKLPGRNAKYFGFHELFHIFVLAAWISQYLAVSFAIYRK